MLEDHAQVLPERLEVPFGELHFRFRAFGPVKADSVFHGDAADAVDGNAAGVRLLKIIDTSDQRGLPRPGVSDDAVNLAAFHADAHILQGVDLLVRRDIGF